jgi:hypothetical protein
MKQTPHIYAEKKSIKSILKANKVFTQDMYSKLLTRPGFKNKGVLAALWHSDIENLVKQLH